jgi:hypothetical protein
MRDHERGICLLVDVAVLEDKNVIKKEAENVYSTPKPYSRIRSYVKC